MGPQSDDSVRQEARGMTPVRDIAKGRWRGLLPLLGVAASFLTGKHGPCPNCDGRDRFRFTDLDGRGTFFCSGCGPGDGIDLVMRVGGMDFKTAAKEIMGKIHDAPVLASKMRQNGPCDAAAMKRLWGAGGGLTGTQGGDYLSSRGFCGPYPTALRFTESCKVEGHPNKQFLPALLALVRGPSDDVVSIHRTYLEEGGKAKMGSPRKLLAGTLPKGSAIRLAKHHGKLGVAEGIETALAVMRDFQIPCWSAINSTMLSQFTPPDGLDELHIFGDNDPAFGGQTAAYHLAHRVSVGKTRPAVVQVHIPIMTGKDFADPKDRS